ncbi:MAG: PSD1 and planctomycete cytochrome C domain-containing protein [Fuerstiella sp.]|nr:PSD1 and planctomycete cytochrome C domain-containing protein [Fuerstiella sp.]
MRPLFILILAISGVRAAEPVDFSREILPILSNKCFVCHGPDINADTDLRLDSPDDATRDRGGYRVVNEADPASSALIKRIHDAEDPMPPAEADRQLTVAEKKLLSQWIQEGGNFAKHWAFVAPRKQPRSDDTVNPVDYFIQKRLKSENLSLAKPARRSTLVRRVALTLTGLPPEPEQLRRFLADETAESWDSLVSELLNSPRYGEHQARYWLDAVRYGDTHGLHLDNRRGIYPYRDWVVRAMNDNLPLDQFITWQLAGDLFPDPSMAQLIATGYVRMNPTTAEGGALPEEFQAKNNFDRTENLGTVFLGMSLICARCHTHKYDPIPQREYYQLLAFFNSTAEPPMDSNAYEFGPTLRVPGDQQAWRDWQQLMRVRHQLIEKVESLVSDGELTEDQAGQWAESDEEARLNLLAADDGPFGSLAVAMESRNLTQKIMAAEEGFTTTLVADDLEQPRATRLLQRGEYHLPTGEELQPGVLSVMGELPSGAPSNRLGLARWLTSREHPLVSRVMINRIWQRTFGHGLVRTPEDFGLQGQQATHPELLDWLAVELQDSGWDLRHMLRLMVSSRTFRQSSAMRSEISDPENRLWSRGPGYRLDAEVLRDIGLWSGNLLDPHMGGEGVKPFQPTGMWKAMAHPGSNTKQYVPDKQPQVNRRSLYVYWKRTSPHPMMTLFDAPDRESSCVRRGRTSTPLQSLGLLNEIQRVAMGRALAGRLVDFSDEDEVRLRQLFILLSSRNPSDQEYAACIRLVQNMRRRYQSAPDDAAALLAEGGTLPSDPAVQAELAAWTQLSITALASDLAIMMY